ncbi:hypothetical protein Hanom_Chr01g00042971 [Helianthus anomalus]
MILQVDLYQANITHHTHILKFGIFLEPNLDQQTNWYWAEMYRVHEKPIVLLSNQSVSDISITKMVCSDVLSNMNPKTVIPARLFSK